MVVVPTERPPAEAGGKPKVGWKPKGLGDIVGGS